MNRKRFKTVACMIAGFSVGTCTTVALKSNLPQETTFQKVNAFIAGGIAGAMASAAAEDYVDKLVDRVADGIEMNRS